MRKSVAVVAGSVLVAGVVGVAVAQSGTAETRPHSFTVVERAVTDTTTDTGAKGDSVGDILTFANPIFDRGDVKRVGSDNGVCTRTVAGDAYECEWTLTIKGSQLMVSGPFYDTRDSMLAITGGTGRWATARGEMLLHARDAKGSAYDFTYTVR